MSNQAGTTVENDVVVITRTVDAPRDLVFKAWTTPDLVMKWWGPEHYTSPVAKIDLKVGGKYLFAMRGPDGLDLYSTGTYLEIDPPKRLVMTDSFSNENGDIVSPTAFGMGPEVPDAMTITVDFADTDGKTAMTITHTGMPAGEMQQMMVMGWTTQLDKLDAALKTA